MKEQINKLIEAIKEKRDQIKSSEEYLNGLKLEKEQLQIDLMGLMESIGTKTYKNDSNTISMVSKFTPVIMDQTALENDLKNRGLYDDLFITKLDKTRLNSTAKAMFKETGEVLDGTDMQESNYLSIKNNN